MGSHPPSVCVTTLLPRVREEEKRENLGAREQSSRDLKTQREEACPENSKVPVYSLNCSASEIQTPDPKASAGKTISNLADLWPGNVPQTCL